MNKILYFLFLIFLFTFIPYAAFCSGMGEVNPFSTGEDDVFLQGWIKTIEDVKEYQEKIEKITEESEKQEKEEAEIREEEQNQEQEIITDETPEEMPEPAADWDREISVPEPRQAVSSAEAGESSSESSSRDQPVELRRIVSDQEVFARLEDRIDVNLEGRGWYFIGEKNGISGVLFDGRSIENEISSFRFIVEDLGEYLLIFQRQDLEENILYEEQIMVHAVTDEIFFKKVNPGETEFSRPEGGGDYTAARRMKQSGRFKDALEEYLFQYQEGDSSINNEIADAAYSLGKYDLAQEFWMKNMDKDNPVYADACIGIIKCAIKQDDMKMFDQIFDDFLALDSPEKAEILLDAAEFQIRNKSEKAALEMLNMFLEDYQDHEKADYACFLAAQIYESPGEQRAVQEAYNYYERLTIEYPTSLYWEESSQRMDYLERHYLRIR